MTKANVLKRTDPSLYNSWRGMIDRCRNLKRRDAHCYAEKGISVCSEWRDPSVFLDWALNNNYKHGLTIDRIDGSKGYAPDNCRWVNRKVQGRNISRNRLLILNGESHCVSEWAEITGIAYHNILARIDRLGWSIEKALTIATGEIPTGPKPRGALQ